MTLTIALAGLIGVLLGLLGGGGSILTVPLLMYVAGLGTRSAIATSLLVVATSSAAALVPHALGGHVRWRAGAFFGGAGIVGAQVGGRLAFLVPESLLLGGFGLMMVVTAVALFRCRRCDGETGDGGTESGEPPAGGKLPLLLQGLGVGVVTGLVGVGGGFLIVPALALFARIPMRAAVGTSLFVIALNSFSGAVAHSAQVSLEASLPLIAASVIGSLAGSALADRVPQLVLRRGLAVVVMAVGLVGFLARPFYAHAASGAGSAPAAAPQPT